jgi:hypothetical protein
VGDGREDFRFGEEDVLLAAGDPLDADLWRALVALAVVLRVGVGWGMVGGAWSAVEESGGVLCALVRVATASSASTRASVVARAPAASEAAGPGPMAAPAAVPIASITAARIALALREGVRRTLGGRGEVIGSAQCTQNN